MGLHMYLEKELYISEFDRDGNLIIEQVLRAIKTKDESGNYAHIRVTVPAIYWRKSNQIHKWFVDNVQNGVDDCGVYYIYGGQLKELLEAINKQLKDRSKIILPPQSGFFFGGTEIDEWYWKDLEKTKTNLERELAFVVEQEAIGRYWLFKYHSSW